MSFASGLEHDHMTIGLGRRRGWRAQRRPRPHQARW